MPGPLLPIAALGAVAYFFFTSSKKKDSPNDAKGSKEAEDKIIDAVDEAAEETAPKGGPIKITPSAPPIQDGITPMEPELVSSGIAGKGSYRVMMLSEVPPIFDAQLLVDQGVWASIGQFNNPETAKSNAISAGIERFGAIGR
jgi:hypothetical protein